MIRFSIDNPGGWSVVVELSNDSNINDTMAAFEAFLLAAGFHKDNVREAIASTDSEASHK